MSRTVAPGVEKIKMAICKAYAIKESSLLSSRRGVVNESRHLAVCFIRRFRGEKAGKIIYVTFPEMIRFIVIQG